MDEAERLPWTSQLELDDASYRRQLAYLLQRSPFYRAKLAGHDTNGGLDAIGSLPLTNTIGIAVVAAMAARFARTLPMMTAAGRRTGSAASSGSRSG